MRLAGLGFVQLSVFDLYYIVVKTFGIPTASHTPVSRDIQGFIIWSILGVAILWGAKILVRVAYWAGADK